MFEEAEHAVGELRGTIKRLLRQVKTTVLAPFRIATSKLAIQAYITSILFAVAGFLFFFIAVASYITLYWSYIPQIGFSRGVHLQYDPIPLECRTYLTQLNLLDPPSPSSLSSLFSGQRGPSDKGELSTLLAAKCGGTPSPWGTAAVNPEVVTRQAYDVVLEMVMPRTPLNTGTGNFMVDARLLSSPVGKSSGYDQQIPLYSNPYDPMAPPAASPSTKIDGTVVAHTRLPALLPYASPALTLADTLFSLPRWFIGLPTDTATLRVPLFSAVVFPKDRKAGSPSHVHIQLVNPRGQQLQVYSVKVQFRARFTGLRYLMYNFRLWTAAAFVGAFFVAEVLAALVAYALLQFVVFGSPSDDAGAGGGKVRIEGVKSEETDGTETDRFLSDAERVFPTYGGQPPLRYPGSDSAKGEGGPSIKREEEQEAVKLAALADGKYPATPGPGAEADDEDDEDADFVLDDPNGRWRDSGIGTSMDSSREGGVRRRRSRGSRPGSLMKGSRET